MRKAADGEYRLPDRHSTQATILWVEYPNVKQIQWRACCFAACVSVWIAGGNWRGPDNDPGSSFFDSPALARLG
jgi:hypothetical protein